MVFNENNNGEVEIIEKECTKPIYYSITYKKAKQAENDEIVAVITPDKTVIDQKGYEFSILDSSDYSYNVNLKKTEMI